MTRRSVTSGRASRRRPPKGAVPTLRFERDLWEAGVATVAGVDEVGRGSWAGPLTVAAVIPGRQSRIYKVRDSKTLTASQREALHHRILGWAEAVCVAHATVTECTELGMSQAQRLATRRALEGLNTHVDHVLVDGAWDFVTPPSTGADSGEQSTDQPASQPTGKPVPSGNDAAPGVTKIVRGDSVSLSIAAASIVAKVTRDRLMAAAALSHPGYWFEFNKGYPCPRHVAALAALGPSAIHRRAWVFMDDLRWSGVPRIGPDVPAAPHRQQELFTHSD